MKAVVFLMLLAILSANAKIRGYHAFLLSKWRFLAWNTDEALTAKISSDYDFDVMANPISFKIIFSSEINSLEENQCIVRIR